MSNSRAQFNSDVQYIETLINETLYCIEQQLSGNNSISDQQELEEMWEGLIALLREIEIIKEDYSHLFITE